MLLRFYTSPFNYEYILLAEKDEHFSPCYYFYKMGAYSFEEEDPIYLSVSKICLPIICSLFLDSISFLF